MDKQFPSFSISMCVYGKDNAVYFDEALKSVIEQTVRASEIVLVVDGPIPERIKFVINKYKELCHCGGEIDFKVIYLPKNMGHGIARRTSVANCKNEIIALMDADDISVCNRFEKELICLEKEKADVVGGDIVEFVGNQRNIVGRRCVPKGDAEIKKYLKKRCPFNQMTVMFKKIKYDEAGGYLDWYCNEDYYLWIRMYLSNAVFANTGTDLVYVRVGNEMYQRRGGTKYFISEAKLQRYMLELKIVSFARYIYNVLIRFIVQVIMPNKVRGFVFKRFARS